MSNYQEIGTGIVPVSSEIWVTDQKYIKGSPKLYSTLEELSTLLHPNLMEIGMSATVGQHSRNLGSFIFKKTIFILKNLPTAQANFPLNIDDPDDSSYYLKFWEKDKVFEIEDIERVFQYAPDINGTKPVFPYIVGEESNWGSTVNINSKWVRWRDSNELLPNGLYKWTIPFPITNSYQSGDYIDRRFIRSATLPDSPPSTIDGAPNNEPIGTFDTPPIGASPLYETINEKNKFGDIQGEWTPFRLIVEDLNLYRYSNSPAPNPNTIVNNSTDIVLGDVSDLALIAAGWVTTPNSTHKYRAQRTNLGGSNYTVWVIIQIGNESGEYPDLIFKKFSINSDLDDSVWIAANTPTIDNPMSGTSSPNLGWQGEPNGELLDNEAWFVSKATKFFDGTLKTPWSPPIPFNADRIFRDYISSNGVNNFKYASSEDVTPIPSTITLTFNLFRNIKEIQSGITYKWFKVADNGVAIEPNVDIDGNPEVDQTGGSPLLSTNKTLVVSPSDVTSLAIFRCYAYFDAGNGTSIRFVEDESIVDITDGNDAKALTISPEIQLTVYNASTTNYSVPTIRIRYYQKFLDSSSFYWYKWNGATWNQLSNGVGGYSISGNLLSIASSDLFTEDTTSEQALFAISTSDTTPDESGVFSDFQTIGKTGVSDGTATDGVNGTDSSIALLSNETVGIVLDQGTGLPQTGELSKAKTLLSVYTGNILKTATDDFTIVLSDTTNFEYIRCDIDETPNASGKYYLIRIKNPSGWTNTTLSRSCNITITYGSLIILKTFDVISSTDFAGALVADIDVSPSSTNKTFSFIPNNRNDILLLGVLNINGTPIVSSEFDSDVVWKFDGNPTLPSIGDRYPVSGTKKDLIRIKRSDVGGNAIRVTCTIVYNGNTYTSTGVTIDDILSGVPYVLFHNFAVVPSEPIAIPAAPTTGTWDSFASTGASLGWYKTQQTNSYFYSIGFEQANETIIFPHVFRFKGEAGGAGQAAGGIRELYRYDSQNIPSGAGTYPTTNEMIGDGWKQLADLTSGSVLYKAFNEFIGANLNDFNYEPSNQWSTLRLTATDGINGTNGVGSAGLNAWQPILATESRNGGLEEVLKVIDWINGTGTKPAINLYITSTGFNIDINLASNIKGTIGTDGNDAIPITGRSNSTIITTSLTSRSADTSSTNIVSLGAEFDALKCLVQISATTIIMSAAGVWFGIEKQVNGGLWNLVKESQYSANTGVVTPISIHITDIKLGSEITVKYRATLRYTSNSFSCIYSGGFLKVDSSSFYIQIQ